MPTRPLYLYRAFRIRTCTLWGILRNRKVAEKVAQFRQIDKDKPGAHHDALEFPNGRIVFVNSLCEGQQVTVLQLPASPHAVNEAKEQITGSLVT